MTTRTDDFAGTHAALSSDWTYSSGFDWIERVSGAAQVVPQNAYGEAYWTADSFGGDQNSKTLGVTGINLGDVCVISMLTRWNSSRDGYAGGPINRFGTVTYELSENTGGVGTPLAVESGSATDGDDWDWAS